MTLGALIAATLGIAALAWVIAPLLRADSGDGSPLSEAVSEARDLQSQREMLLASLKDLEDDHDTAKVGDEDYEELKARLTRQAVDVMKRLDEAQTAALEESARPKLRSVPDPEGTPSSRGK
jgi:hypothetical protein